MKAKYPNNVKSIFRKKELGRDSKQEALGSVTGSICLFPFYK